MIRLVLLVVLVLLILAFKFLPWYVLVGLAVLLVFGSRYLLSPLLMFLFSMPFRAKGSVLRKAEVVIHSIEPAPPPAVPARAVDADDFDDEDESGRNGDEPDAKVELLPAAARDYYRLTATIKPRPKTGGFQHWEPGDLCLVLPESSLRDDPDDVCVCHEVEIEENGRFIPDEGFKPSGEQKLRMLLEVVPGTRRLVFRYYFERFGEVLLPTG